MSISYHLIRKIHLYACLSTAALLVMFILTSYIMIHHDWFSHEPAKTTATHDLGAVPASERDWQALADQYGRNGRMFRESTDQDGNPVREYGDAEGSTRVTLLSGKKQVQVDRTDKSGADAIVGIHRQRGYAAGPLKYNLYAFLLDVLSLSLILFAVTGVILWFRTLKNSKVAWMIFIGGFIYFSITMALLMYG